MSANFRADLGIKSDIQFTSSLSGLQTIFIDDSVATEGSPGTAYFHFINPLTASDACIAESKSWELYCVPKVPVAKDDRTCFGFAVRSEVKSTAGIDSMHALIKRINYWMRGTSTEKDPSIPVIKIGQEGLKDRDFSVPQKDYGFLADLGLKLAAEDPFQEPQDGIKSVNNSTVHENQKKDPKIEVLVNDLEKKPPSDLRDAIIHDVRQGRYSDELSTLPMPKVALYQELKAAGFDDIAKSVMDGKYD